MFQPGDRVGRYGVQRRLRRGGTANAHAAADRVFRQRRAAAALSHVKIVLIHAGGVPVASLSVASGLLTIAAGGLGVVDQARGVRWA